ncbi:hypothetical protein VNO80_25980 [Phaseolus coccineus]|uniref:Uncharacterized protein n=1 Tax=Phaseolus coccineus TaxID=3886 RepID=A0AAN9LVS4_PHACN
MDHIHLLGQGKSLGRPNSAEDGLRFWVVSRFWLRSFSEGAAVGKHVGRSGGMELKKHSILLQELYGLGARRNGVNDVPALENN